MTGDAMIETAGIKDPTNPDAEIWRGLRLQVRKRCAAAIRKLIETGTLNREYIMACGEVSVAQASLDLREIRKRIGNLLVYDMSAKCYRLKETD